ncbi:hypothetical protein RFI_36822, partial [Reticulomyxa filosa]
DEVNHLKSEKEIYEKKQSEEISKMNNDNQLLKQQLKFNSKIIKFAIMKKIKKKMIPIINCYKPNQIQHPNSILICFVHHPN